eukprot:SM000140S00598  [mRNA]  locus=s140:88759:92277:+ [translate_table: standard]
MQLGLAMLTRSIAQPHLGSWAQVASSVAQRFIRHGGRLLEQAAADVESGPYPFQAALRSARDALLADHPALVPRAVPFAHLARTADLRAQARFMAEVDAASFSTAMGLLSPDDLRGRARLLSASSPGAAACPWAPGIMGLSVNSKHSASLLGGYEPAVVLASIVKAIDQVKKLASEIVVDRASFLRLASYLADLRYVLDDVTKRRPDLLKAGAVEGLQRLEAAVHWAYEEVGHCLALVSLMELTAAFPDDLREKVAQLRTEMRSAVFEPLPARVDLANEIKELLLNVDNQRRRGKSRVSLVEEGVVPPLVDLLNKGTVEAKAAAVYALEHLSHVELNRVHLSKHRAIPALVQNRNPGPPGTREAAEATFTNLALVIKDIESMGEGTEPQC